MYVHVWAVFIYVYEYLKNCMLAYRIKRKIVRASQKVKMKWNTEKINQRGLQVQLVYCYSARVKHFNSNYKLEVENFSIQGIFCLNQYFFLAN